ncbi:MAG: hypothetical protein AMJ81_00375 [Phycisphaerae bacterium SM23_33]|nr:MAG: hypothetical protein AMJ81_00375 [Phycisphaerae bacterium SM23_33]
MDIATIIGVLAGFLLIFLSVGSGPSHGAEFFHVPSLMITVGGMFSATLTHFSLGQVLKIVSLIKKTVFCKLPQEQDLIQRMVNYSAISRRDGALVLERQIPEAGDPFLAKGLQMVVDGIKEEEVAQELTKEIDCLQQRHEQGKRVLEFMGSAAPAFGMIGTLIGLVQMLGRLKNPEEIGGGMATALITTFYGALMANLLFLPLAGKLGIYSRREAILRQMALEGLLSIVRGESPTAVRERMQAFLSAKNREELKPSV